MCISDSVQLRRCFLSLEEKDILISELKKKIIDLEARLEEVARESYLDKRLFSEIYDSIPLSVVVFDSEGVILKNNNAKFCKYLDSNVFEFLDQVNKEVCEDVRNFVQNMSVASLEREVSVSNSASNVDEKDYFLISIVMLHGYSGKQFLLIAHQITDFKNIELKRLELQTVLMERSYREGVAEAAISVLHNIGNVLTSLVCVIEELSSQEGTEGISQLSLLNNKLFDKYRDGSAETFFSAPDNIDSLLGILKLIEKDLIDESTLKGELIRSLRNKTSHISNIITVQQKYAQLKKGFRTTIKLGAILDDVFLINEARVKSEYLNLSRLENRNIQTVVEKNNFLQVLSNIINNSIDSIEERVKSDDRFEMGSIEVWTEEGVDKTALCFSDDGVGIDSDTLPHVYDFGFSTKGRSSGFGLHNCKVFLERQNMEIDVSSKGKNKGTKVVISIPR